MENKKEKIKKFIKNNLGSIELTVFYFVYLILVITAIKDTKSVFLAVSVIFLTVIFAIFTILLFQGASDLKKENEQLKKQCENLGMKLEVLHNEYADLVAENTKRELREINKNLKKGNEGNGRKNYNRKPKNSN